MKSLLLSAVVLAGLCSTLQAQTAAPATAPAAPAPAAGAAQGPGGLTTDERSQMIAAHTKALAANPDLGKEEAALQAKAATMMAGSPTDADKTALRAEVQAHIVKLRAAMLQADPSVKPIMDRLDAARAAAGH